MKNPKKLFADKHMTWQLEEEHKVFVLWFQEEDFQKPNPFKDSKLFFFCAFCEVTLIQLNRDSEVLEVNVKTFYKSWKYATHYWATLYEVNEEENSESFCPDVKLLAYDYKLKCLVPRFDYQLMKESTRLNFTIYLNKDENENFAGILGPFSISDPEMFTFSTLLFLQNVKTGIIHCINTDFKLSVNDHMWIHNISPHI